MSKHTPGPLTVKIDDEWPFKIRTLDENGKCVFSRDMPCYSTKQTKKEHVLSGKYMEDPAKAAAAVEKVIANEVLRAAAPELLEALQVVYESLCVSYPLHSCDMDKRAVILGKARAAIAKAEAA